MLVRDAGESFEIVLQPDHGDLAADIAAAWAERLPMRAALLHAARRHDDGWAAWERAPGLDEQGHPRSFMSIDARTHVQLYRAGAAVALADDPGAGLLVSMHGTGLYRGRYGLSPGARVGSADDAPEVVEAYLAEQDALQSELIARLGVEEDERWAAYHLLQAFDVLSLLFFLAPEAEHQVAGAPRGPLALSPAGEGRVRVDPYPFAAPEMAFTVPRRTLPKRTWTDLAEFRSDFRAAPVRPMRIVAVG